MVKPHGCHEIRDRLKIAPGKSGLCDKTGIKLLVFRPSSASTRVFCNKRDAQPHHLLHEVVLATRLEMSGFLVSIEKRAFKQAVYAVRDDEAALDIVQDSMLKLADRYCAKPANELPMLFQRILQNTIRDHFRRQKVRSTWTSLFSAFGSQNEDEDSDFLETLPVEDKSNLPSSPAARFEQAQMLRNIEEAIEKLPTRQREAFLLRYWEELDVNETALAMGCSEGSVKTHCSRAVRALATSLKAKGITL